MKFIITLLLWFVLLALSWPLAIAVAILWPLVWLLALPFRVAGIAVSAVLGLVRALLFLPARLLGQRG
ncbi:MAG: hypothetical protein R3E77_14370 [Steroidobacteraceae bacterium]